MNECKDDRYFRIDCVSCGGSFEYAPTDVTSIEYGFLFRDSLVVCPFCGRCFRAEEQ